MRIVRIAAAAATAITAFAVTPASAHYNLPPAAAGTTTVQAAHSGSLDLTLRDDARISIAGENNPDVRISGPGRIVGAFLYRLDGNSDGLMALRLPAAAGGRTISYVTSSDPSAKPKCTSFPSATVPLQQQCDSPPTSGRLHQGVYRLVVLTDGAPVTVTLKLHGLRGERSLRPTSALPSGVGSLNLLPNPTGGLARAAATMDTSRTGLMLTLAVGKWAAKPTYFGSYGCLYDGGDPVGEQMLPDCPGGSGTAWSIIDPLHEMPSGAMTGASLSWAYGVGAGSYTLGQGLESDNGVSIVTGLSAWVAMPGLS
jgi:hypothetical protein